MTANFIIEVVKSMFGISDTKEPAQSDPPEEGTEITIEREGSEEDSEPEVSEGEDTEAATETAESSDESTEDITATEPEVEETPGKTEESTDESDSEMAAPVGEINGIGPTYSERLIGAGIETVADLGEADADLVADAAEVSDTRAADWIEQANEF